MTDKLIGVFLADDQADICSALRLLIDVEPGVHVVGESPDAVDLIDQICDIPTDIVLLDWELPGTEHFTGGVSAVVKRHRPAVKIIALSGNKDARTHAMSSGVDHFVSKGDAPEVLLAALREMCGNINKED